LLGAVRKRYKKVFNTTNENSINISDIVVEEEKLNKSLSNNSTILFSPLSLLQINDNNIYAFSDRLIEYLTQHAINHLDTFTKDIERVQSYSKSDINQLKNNSRYNGDIVPGVWDRDFQEYLFKLTKNSKLLRRYNGCYR
jgi:hypothetical protein